MTTLIYVARRFHANNYSYLPVIKLSQLKLQNTIIKQNNKNNLITRMRTITGAIDHAYYSLTNLSK